MLRLFRSVQNQKWSRSDVCGSGTIQIVVTWNCSKGAYSKKVPQLDRFVADVAVIQECAKPEVESERCLWFGDNSDRSHLEWQQGCLLKEGAAAGSVCRGCCGYSGVCKTRSGVGAMSVVRGQFRS